MLFVCICIRIYDFGCLWLMICFCGLYLFVVWVWLCFGYGVTCSRVAGVDYVWLVLWRSPLVDLIIFSRW